MTIAIMQPYFFPYIGYWQLINAVDKFIILDDVTFIKQGYINRNTILSQGKPQRINLQINNISSNKLILNHSINENEHWKKKLLSTIQQSYSKAEYFSLAFPVIEKIIRYPENNLSRFLRNQIILICNYLNITTEIIGSSTRYRAEELKGEERVISICKAERADTYINSIGGKTLYNPERFQRSGICLKFLKSSPSEYNQKIPEFIPNLSIIDVMMHNAPSDINSMLHSYSLE